MSVKVKDIIRYMEDLAPLEDQQDWDNSGIQIGDYNRDLSSVILAMDVTDKLVIEAIKTGSGMIISHHPLFFTGEKSIDYTTYRGRLIKRLIKEDIFVYSSHTNLDIARGGVNDVLANILKIKDLQSFDHVDQGQIGVYGQSSFKNLNQLLEKINWSICPRDHIRIYGRLKKRISKLAIVGGSGGSMISMAKDLGCDTIITGDMTHHKGQEAYEKDIMAIDLGHFYSELPVLISLSERLREEFPIEFQVFKDPVWVHNDF